jgi:hypothetical protein
MVVFALQPKGYAASLIYTPFDRTSVQGLLVLISDITKRLPVELENQLIAPRKRTAAR